MACQVDFVVNNSMRSSPVNPEMKQKNRVKRILFGVPEPGSIDKIIEKENEKQLERMQRYQLLNHRNDCVENRQRPKEMPTRIAQEVKNYEEQQRQQKCNSNRANESYNNSDQDDDGSNIVTNVKKPLEPATKEGSPVNNKGLGSNCEWHKSNKKQLKITDYLYSRKTPRKEGKTCVTKRPLEELTHLQRATMSSSATEFVSTPVSSSQLK